MPPSMETRGIEGRPPGRTAAQGHPVPAICGKLPPNVETDTPNVGTRTHETKTNEGRTRTAHRGF